MATYTWGSVTLNIANGYQVIEPAPFSTPPIDAGAAILRGYWNVPGQHQRRVADLWQDVMHLRVHGTSAADLRTKIAALQTEYQKPTNTLQALLAGAGEATRTINLLGQPSMSVPVTVRREALHVVEVDVPLVGEPFWCGSAQSYAPAAQLFPSIFDCGTILGDYPTPLTLEFAFAGSVHMQSIWCGRLAPGSTLIDTDLLIEGEGGTWYGETSSDVAMTNGHDSTLPSYTARYKIGTGYATKYGVDQSFNPGTYLPLVRAAMENSADTGVVGFNYGFGFGQTQAVAFGPSGTTLQIKELGQVRLPNQIARGAQQSTLRMAFNSSSAVANHGTYYDYLGLLPTSWGWFRVLQPIGAGNDLTSFRVQGDGSVFWNDVGTLTYFAGGPIEAVGPTKLAVFTEAATLVAKHTGACTVTYIPRYATV